MKKPEPIHRSSFIVHRSSLARGIELFNSHEFWHAHEAWEKIWLASSGDERRFLQGLIQLAAAYHHVQRGTYRGGIRLFDAAFEKLEQFPPGHADVDRALAIAAAHGHRARIVKGERVDPSEYPKLRVSSG
ncbi:MAG TPA: DUF309 domain-containing protein [Thermoanaerobaculia bacterium]|nr:DUF309 domain-containing protein [Thermoanaerobaculia bacterium]